MTVARNQIIDLEKSTIYHCWSRCVRRAFLCGIDRLTGKDYGHRKQWVIDRLVFLSEVFFIEVICYAVLSNHNHLLLRIKEQGIDEVSDEEIAYRWLRLFHTLDQWDPELNVPKDEAVSNLAQDKHRIRVLRDRLSSLSWFMRCLKENIAMKANSEDEVTGHFWEKRFSCQRIEDDAGLVTCMTYIDLNEIRAGVASCPEESYFTSAYHRIVAIKAQERLERKEELTQKTRQISLSEAKTDSWLSPFQDQSPLISIIPISRKDYLKLLDETGRLVAEGKKGAISSSLAPILVRLKIDAERWIECAGGAPSNFSHVVGTASAIRQTSLKLGKRWMKGIRFARLLFLA